MITKKRGSLFFTLDALLAGLIILVTIIMVLSVQSSQPVVEDISHDLNNYMNFISGLTIREVRNLYGFAYNSAFQDSMDMYVHQKVFELYLLGGDNVTLAKHLIGNLTLYSGILPLQRGFEYAVGNDVVFSYNKEKKQFAKTSITNRLLTHHVKNNNVNYITTNITMWS